jgi:hypothetical protein
MSRLAALLLLLLAASCASPPSAPAPVPGTVAAATVPAASAVCRVAANGGPVLADRGIGGTGIESDESRLAERGIGGTGIGTEIPQSVVRGLTQTRGVSNRPTEAKPGDAGIVGVITGFSSVCIDGMEVGLDGAVPMQIDGTSVQGTALRAGQMAVIEAAIDAGSLRSLNLAVRHEVTGPVERLDPTAGTMTVAGQTVVVPSGTRGAGSVAVGNWASISGLRRPDDSIVATRLDAATAGLVTLHGRVVSEGGKLRIGGVTLMPPAGARVGAGAFVTVTGHYAAGVLRAETLETDLLAQDPAAFFGGSIHRIIERAVVRIESGRVVLGDGVSVPLAPGLSVPAGDAVDAVITMDRGADGTYAVTRVQAAPAAPMP